MGIMNFIIHGAEMWSEIPEAINPEFWIYEDAYLNATKEANVYVFPIDVVFFSVITDLDYRALRAFRILRSACIFRQQPEQAANPFAFTPRNKIFQCHLNLFVLCIRLNHAKPLSNSFHVGVHYEDLAVAVATGE